MVEKSEDMPAAVEIRTNGRIHIPWVTIWSGTSSMLLAVIVWLALKTIDRIDRLEQSDKVNSGSIAMIQQLRPEDKQMLVEAVQATRRLELNVARLMAKMDVEEVR